MRDILSFDLMLLLIVKQFYMLDLTIFLINPLCFNNGNLTLNSTMTALLRFHYGLLFVAFLLDVGRVKNLVKCLVPLRNLSTHMSVQLL
ncbi:hypothetical protein MTR67_023661 [Solanum verrucosum]|uniref:Uncharacterized protein n=1 Tax=Solanum verrucosum TaxID=315347 RepID=A0AAF0TS20_SOLVR|nr:hypothetical protein MTR67_023661 [Solanum verrucosum]